MTVSRAMASPQGAGATVSPAKIALWTVLFQIAWFWRRLPALLQDGAMPDTDDFQRLSEVRAWMGGQGWYDLFNHRMDPPLGADMHWSRLVDVPLAALISFFDLFLDPVMAERVTAIVWPVLLLVATVFVVLAVCRRLQPDVNPLLALLFTVTCITALTEFMPGRLDHHNVQILLYCLMLLGLVSGGEWWGRLLLGAAAAASISVGLDAILIIAFLLFWVGMEWVTGRDRDGRDLRRTAAGIAAAALPLYAANIAPSQWFVARCDANSVFYLAALLYGAAAFAGLSAFSRHFDPSTRAGMLKRLGAGAVAGAAVVGALAAVWPQCLAGPYGELAGDLVSRWLVNVSEARGVLQLIDTSPELLFYAVGYSALLLAVSGVVVIVHGRGKPQYGALFAVLAISVAASVLQYRAMRIGIFASIPFCVLFAGMAWEWIRPRVKTAALAGALQTALVAMLASPLWIAIGAVVFPAAQASAPEATQAGSGETAGGWRDAEPYIFCNRESDYRTLAGLPDGVVMSDINSGAVIPVLTGHASIGGPYHRNGKAILDMLDFFETDLANPRRIAAERGFAYVAWCEPVEALDPDEKHKDALAVHILAGTEPDWLERLSPRGDRLHVFRVKTLQN